MFDDIATKDLKHVGHNAGRPDMTEKLTGEAMYVSDMILPGMLHVQLKKSPHARARIIKVDATKAAALPGVRAIVTGAELDYRMGLYVVDKHILAKGEVRHYGEAVAAVAADTLEQARAAVEAIEIEYQVLEPVLHHMDALKPKAPLVHPDLGTYAYIAAAFTPKPGTNIANHTKLRKGDVDKGFEQSE
mgnify:FL=1